ncbi:hypothetical protein PFISCL1PPCAC_26541 [Pristionchus fissidentatus]|uniref:Uncharacterized protein n=1 Tax=Pristionchus fissidentatus TaxID=1538716 RepID=A0AAV5X0J9_9BILA|nr:hypothetical protein PFISCL1PPCAC_26541 [Pristionchus fissidentatus]
MKFILLIVVSLPLASATLSKCEKDLLKRCRKCDLPLLAADKSCPLVGYDCSASNEELKDFNVTRGSYERDCDLLRCQDPLATLFVEGVPYQNLGCSENLWRFGKHYTLNTTTAACIRRCDNCKVYVPSSEGFPATPAQIVAPVIGRPCASVECKPGFELYGKSVEDGEIMLVTEDLQCTGDRLWVNDVDAAMVTVFCKPNVEGDN